MTTRTLPDGTVYADFGGVYLVLSRPPLPASFSPFGSGDAGGASPKNDEENDDG